MDTFHTVGEILLKALIETLCLDKAKIGSSLSDAQLNINGHQYPDIRKDRNSEDGGKTVFVRKGIIAEKNHQN